LLLSAESPAMFRFPKVVEEGWHSVDDVTMDAVKGVGVGGEAYLCTAVIGLSLYLGCHRGSASPTVAGKPARFRGAGWEVIEGKRRNRKMFELQVPGLAGRGRSKGSGSSRGSGVWTKMPAVRDKSELIAWESISDNAVFLPLTILRQAETSVNTWRQGAGSWASR
jgi:hypothetical protein